MGRQTESGYVRCLEDMVVGSQGLWLGSRTLMRVLKATDWPVL